MGEHVEITVRRFLTGEEADVVPSSVLLVEVTGAEPPDWSYLISRAIERLTVDGMPITDLRPMTADEVCISGNGEWSMSIDVYGIGRRA